MCVCVRAFVRACVRICIRLVKDGRLEVGVEERGRLYTYRYTVTIRITIYFIHPSRKQRKIATREVKHGRPIVSEKTKQKNLMLDEGVKRKACFSGTLQNVCTFPG